MIQKIHLRSLMFPFLTILIFSCQNDEVMRNDGKYYVYPEDKNFKEKLKEEGVVESINETEDLRDMMDSLKKKTKGPFSIKVESKKSSKGDNN